MLFEGEGAERYDLQRVYGTLQFSRYIFEAAKGDGTDFVLERVGRLLDQARARVKDERDVQGYADLGPAGKPLTDPPKDR